MAQPTMSEPEAFLPVASLRRRGFKSPFGAFGGTVFCPHCGYHYPRADLEVVERAKDDAGRLVLAVRCPKCHAHGLIAAGEEKA